MSKLTRKDRRVMSVDLKRFISWRWWSELFVGRYVADEGKISKTPPASWSMLTKALAAIDAESIQRAIVIQHGQPHAEVYDYLTRTLDLARKTPTFVHKPLLTRVQKNK